MRVPQMEHERPTLDFEAETTPTSLTCRPLTAQGVAIATIDDETHERSLATTAPLTGPGPHTALIKLKRVLTNDQQSDTTQELVARLRLRMRSTGGGLPDHILRLLIRALRTPATRNTATGEPDYDAWIRRIVVELKAVQPMPDVSPGLRELIDAFVDLLLELLTLARLGDHVTTLITELARMAQENRANTVHFRLRGEQTVLVDPAPIA